MMVRGSSNFDKERERRKVSWGGMSSAKPEA